MEFSYQGASQRLMKIVGAVFQKLQRKGKKLKMGIYGWRIEITIANLESPPILGPTSH